MIKKAEIDGLHVDVRIDTSEIEELGIDVEAAFSGVLTGRDTVLSTSPLVVRRNLTGILEYHVLVSEIRDLEVSLEEKYEQIVRSA